MENTDKYVWVMLQDGEVYAYSSARTVEEAMEEAQGVGCDQVLRIDEVTAREILARVK